MSRLREMMKQHAQTGSVTWIGVRPERRADMLELSEVQVSQSGLDGDRSRGGKRAVTIMQAEHLPVIGALLGAEISPDVFRRNIVVRGLNVAALRGQTFRIGDALLRGMVPCHPCSRMEEALGHGGYTAMRGHGGLCAEVLDGALIRLGSVVAITEDAPEALGE